MSDEATTTTDQVTEGLMMQGLIAQTALAIACGAEPDEVDLVLRFMENRIPAKTGSGLARQFREAVVKVRNRRESETNEHRRRVQANLRNFRGF